MTNLVLRVPALLCILSSVTTACAWSQARPTLVLQLRRVERGTRTMEGTQHVQDLVLSASVSMALEQADVEAPDFYDSEPSGLVPLEASVFDATFSCGPSPTLCAWAYSAEQVALAAAAESHGVEL
jgi:hypothetical protein